MFNFLQKPKPHAHDFALPWQGASAAGAPQQPALHATIFMTSRQAKIQEDTCFRVMRILEENPDLTQRELAEKLGVSVGGLNYCLKALMEKGWVKMQNFGQSKNKFGYVYILTPSGMAEKAALFNGFLKRKMDEYDALRAEIKILKSERTARMDAAAGAGPGAE